VRLSHRNYRVLWFAALASTIGTWMQSYAQSWLVFDLTHSNFFWARQLPGQLPIILFMLIGGVVADRHDRRRLLTGSQLVQAFAALSLALLVATGQVTIALIFLLSFTAGCGQAFGGPAYQAMIPSLVPRRDLPNAIALNSTQFNLSRVLGPMAGGAVLAAVGVVWCFTLNGLSFFIVVVALASMTLAPHVPNPKPIDLKNELKNGLTTCATRA
jgi:MFS family permease